MIFLHDLVPSSHAGGWERGRLQGRGLYAWAGGAQYEGTFQSNQITGTGVRGACPPSAASSKEAQTSCS